MARFSDPVSSGGSGDLPQPLATTSSPTFSKITLTSNGATNNITIGDDAIIGDGNVANHIVIIGQQDDTQGGIVLGNNETEKISSDGNGNIQFYMDGAVYIGDVDSDNQIITRANLDEAVAPLNDSNWVGVTNLSNSYVVGSVTPGYRKLNGVVYLRGNFHQGTAGEAAFVLPEGFRPEYETVMLSQKFGTSAGTYVTITAGGQVISHDNATWLSGISFISG